eukprot:INCI8268.1.p1 GENE.INCI8268.1~~INCI8268.1.p1  ORF type:complete len:147 (+),score=22.31 INCI8268.1:268-708(+)
MERYLLPAAAGFLAALGGAVAKCAVDADNRGCLDKFGISPDECPIWVDALNLSCDTFVFVVRIVWGVTMLAINGYMLELFVKSLHAVGSVSTTVIHLVANFACTALIGALAFEEELPVRYGLGVSIMVIGVWLVQHGTGGPRAREN